MLIYSRIPDVVYSNSWAEGKIFILRSKGLAGDLEVLDEIETGGKGLNSMAVLPDCSAIVGAHVSKSVVDKALTIVWFRECDPCSSVSRGSFRPGSACSFSYRSPFQSAIPIQTSKTGRTARTSDSDSWTRDPHS